MFDNLRENFEIILIVLLLISTVTYIIHRLTVHREVKNSLNGNHLVKKLSRKERKKAYASVLDGHLNTPMRRLNFFFADLFWVLAFIVVLRSFFYEPFIIPSGSMKPGLQIGDIILVNKYEKGWRLPVTNKRLTEGSPIERGDVIVFKYPKNKKISYIKRVIGLPGDKIEYDNRKMRINGKAIDLRLLTNETDEVELKTRDGHMKKAVDFRVYEEDLLGKPHSIRYASKYKAPYPAGKWTVPENHYFVMGDNRDNSADGRDFGFLSDDLIIGHATRIVLNFECVKGNGLCDRFFKKIL